MIINNRNYLLYREIFCTFLTIDTIYNNIWRNRALDQLSWTNVELKLIRWPKLSFKNKTQTPSAAGVGESRGKFVPFSFDRYKLSIKLLSLYAKRRLIGTETRRL